MSRNIPLGVRWLRYMSRFTLDPNTSLFQNIFPAKTKRIYAVWEYRNMHDGLIVRRDWYHNDKLWISRQEPWDYAKYGASGTMRDISVYELDAGLPFGTYRFELYIDAQPQPILGGVKWGTVRGLLVSKAQWLAGQTAVLPCGRYNRKSKRQST